MFNEMILKGMTAIKANNILIRNGYTQTFVKEIGRDRVRVGYSFTAAGVTLREFEMLIVGKVVFAISKGD